MQWKRAGRRDWVDRLHSQTVRAHEVMMQQREKKYYPVLTKIPTQTKGYIEEKLYETALKTARNREEWRAKQLDKIREPAKPATIRPLEDVLERLYHNPRKNRPNVMATLEKKHTALATLPKVAKLPGSTVREAVDRLHTTGVLNATQLEALDRRAYPVAEPLVLDAAELDEQVRRLHDESIADRAVRMADAADEAAFRPLGVSGLLTRAHALRRAEDPLEDL